MKQTTVAALIATALPVAPVTAGDAEVAIHGGWSSEYIFRGVPQSDSSGFAGIDFEQSGLYLGTWAADVGENGQGFEVDLFGGYARQQEQYHYSFGVTSYLYTDDFDDRYTEVNLSGGYRALNLDVAIGEYENFSGPTLRYQYFTLAMEYDGLVASFSVWGDDYTGKIMSIAYSNSVTVGGSDLLDYSFAIVHSTDISIAGSLLNDDDTSLVLTISKSFDLK